MLSEWAEKARPHYSSVELGHEEAWLYPTRDPMTKSDERYLRVSQLRQEGLDEARESGADYLLVSALTCWCAKADLGGVLYCLKTWENPLRMGVALSVVKILTMKRTPLEKF